MPSNFDLIDLCRRLKQEKLFVANERKEIEGLNRKVQLLSTGLLHQTWLTGQHRLALENMSTSNPLSSPFTSPFAISSHSSDPPGGDVTENLELVQAHKLISGRYLQHYIDLISLLRNHPEIVALLLSEYEKERRLQSTSTTSPPPPTPSPLPFGDILQGVINIYGGIGGPLPGDGTSHLKLLSHLVGYQLLGASSPRRVLRQGSCAFSFLYRLISETTPSSRLFLVGALHQPITQLLSSPELLSIATNIPSSASSPMEVSGDNTSNSSNTLQNKDIAQLDRTEKMAKLTKLFIDSILDNIHSFPPGLAWLIKSIHLQLSSSHPEKEVSTICSDLIWALFICPAVTNPEPFGVTDAPVGSQARHTLSQVATILQAMALHRWEGVDHRLQEYMAYLDPDCLSAVLEHVLTIDSLPGEQNGIVASLSRRTILIPENLMHTLFTWLKQCLPLVGGGEGGKVKNLEVWAALEKLTASVNESFGGGQPVPPPPQSQGGSQQQPVKPSPLGGGGTPGSSFSGSNPSLASSGSPSHSARLLESGRRALMNRATRGQALQNHQGPPNQDPRSESPISVVVFPTTQSAWEWVGMLPESEVVSTAGGKNGKIPPGGVGGSVGGGGGGSNSSEIVDALMGGGGGSGSGGGSVSGGGGGGGGDDGEDEDRGSLVGEKRTRFSLSHDDGSIGTSDNLEAVSEAASTHSVSSSIELEDQNDNLSDMLSANVSGRGTPNVSGRNTPLSQQGEEVDDGVEGAIPGVGGVDDIDDDDDIVMNDVGGGGGGVGGAGPMEEEIDAGDDLMGGGAVGGAIGGVGGVVVINPPNLNNLNLNGPDKQARREIEDKFCKFEIKKQFEGDETVSLVSDTWSTDVLASDSEMGGDLLLHNPPPLPVITGGGAVAGGGGERTPGGGGGLRIQQGRFHGGNQGRGGGGERGEGDPPQVMVPMIPDNLLNNETMSEAWSTDVAASDIGRLNDFDTDDASSVARSDDTGRSELDGMAYDTPRSSVSGSGAPMPPFRPRREGEGEPDLLMFDDVVSGGIGGGGGGGGQPSQVPVDGGGVLPMDMGEGGSSQGEGREVPVAGPSSGLLLAAPRPQGGGGGGGMQQKTISFDKTAERGDRESWGEDDANGRNSTNRFFRKFRLPFRGRNRKPAAGGGGVGAGGAGGMGGGMGLGIGLGGGRGLLLGEDAHGHHHNNRLIDWSDSGGRLAENGGIRVRKSVSSSEEPGPSGPPGGGGGESSDDILAKYRRKPSLTSDGVPSGDSPNLLLPSTPGPSKSSVSSPAVVIASSVARKDSLKMTRSEMIIEARKKLRNVLSNCELNSPQMDGPSIDLALSNLLRVEMASAISRADQVSAAHLQDALRTVRTLGGDGCRKVMRLMRDDYRRRSDYISYLMRAKQGLLSTIQFLERATVRAKHEGDTYSHYLINECIRVWLEEPGQSQYVEQFSVEFRQATAIDEKIELLEGFLSTLTDMFVGSKELSEWQIGRTENALEQYIVSRVYVYALYPNGDGDLDRDRVLMEHIGKLEGIVTPSHRDLRIPKGRLGECPWPPAQRELRMLSAYKTPGDKLRCVIRACSLIVNLLSSSSEKVVAADDFVPVLVFVLIKSNPPALLSTIQYVNSFCGQRITGEEGYWWTQFCSAVEFIKTMDYTE